MKIFKSVLWIAVSAIVCFGCRKPIEVSFVNTLQEVAPEGDTVVVALESNGEWNIVSTSEWITISPMSGNGNAQLTLIVAANTSLAIRTAEVKASSKDNSATLKVAQGFVSNFLQVVPNEINCDYMGGVFDLEVRSNVEWRLSELPEWISASVSSGINNGNCTLTIDPIFGDVSESREFTITVSGGALLALVHVSQTIEPQYSFSVTPMDLNFDYVGGTGALVVVSNINWLATTEADWLSFTPSEGDSDAEVIVVVTENEVIESREAHIQFSYTYPDGSSANTSVMVHQKAAPNPHFLSVNPLNLEFDIEGGSAEITIECDTDWLVDSQQVPWISCSVNEGSGNGSFVISVEANETTMERDAEVLVLSDQLRDVIVIHQEGVEVIPEFSFLTDTVFISPEGDVKTLYFTSNISWHLTAPSWILLLSPSGVGDGHTGVIVERNPTSNARIGTIEATYNGQFLAQAVVYQEGRVLMLETSVTEINAPREGGVYTIDVMSNQSWTVSKGASWLHYTPINGYGNGTIEVQVDMLDSTRPRTAEIFLQGNEDGLVIITVNQGL